MLLTKFKYFFTLFILVSLLQSPALATKKSYIVYLGEHSHGPEVTTADLQRATDSHHTLLASYLGSKAKAKEAIFYSYKRVFNGFAAVLEEKEVAEIAQHPDVLSVFPNEGVNLQTTHSWEFLLNLENDGVIPPSSIWKKARFGEDTIIANIDSGVWPESKSFNDEGLGPIPSKWKGICQNDNGSNFTCNRKLIGARYFNKGYIAYAKEHNISVVLNESLSSPRDHLGHGSHTLTTAGGSFAPGANTRGLGNGTAKGGSPRARVAAYKVCWPPIDGSICFNADIMKAFDMAIYDGVDVLSLSIGSLYPVQYSQDAIAIGAFHAVKKGIVVVAAAGNNGPGYLEVVNVAPWIITVGASKTDRDFVSYVRVENGPTFKGLSQSKALEDKLYPLVTGDQAKVANASYRDGIYCLEGALDKEKVKGKILVCLNGGQEWSLVIDSAAHAGAAGVVLCNDIENANYVISIPYAMPATCLSYSDGQLLLEHMNSTKNPTGYITPPKTEFHRRPAPTLCITSSRGPNAITPEILKPDIIAPGYDIIAASSEDEPTGYNLPFAMLSGTSMATPHISGTVGLLKTLHPDWSPAAIRSAIMTTAGTRDNTGKPILDYVGYSGEGTKLEPATPFGYGAGHVRPNQAMDPGLVYDLTINDYLNFLCLNKTEIKAFSNNTYKCPEKVGILSFNNPSITVPQLGSGPVSVSRTVKNVGGPGNYTARIRNPYGVSVTVEPNVLHFDKIGEERTFRLIIKARKLSASSKEPPAPSTAETVFGKEYFFGKLIWSDGHHFVRSQIVVSHDDAA